MNIHKTIAGIFAGTGGLLLVYLGYVEYGVIILTNMMTFFVGEANGQRIERNKST